MAEPDRTGTGFVDPDARMDIRFKEKKVTIKDVQVKIQEQSERDRHACLIQITHVAKLRRLKGIELKPKTETSIDTAPLLPMSSAQIMSD